MRIVDPGKAVHMDMILTPETYKCDTEFNFGVNLQMFYKLLKSLRNDETLEVECDGSVMKISQVSHCHTLVHQEIVASIPEILDFTGPKVTLPTKLLQKYLRALGNIAPALELNYVPSADALFLESVNSMYRTLFSIDTGITPNVGEEEYRKRFLVKFFEMAINPSLADNVNLTFGDSLMINYEKENLSVLVIVAGYTEG